MAYRRSHYRRGYYRRTPSGGITWVSPTIVSGYEYTPGIIIHDGNIYNLEYYDNGNPIDKPSGIEKKDTIGTICSLFRTLDSNERKHCLDILEAIDIALDEDIGKSTKNEATTQIESDEYIFTFLEDDTLCLSKYKGFDKKELVIPAIFDSHEVTMIGDAVFKGCMHLNRVTIEEGIRFIGKECFYDCQRISIVDFPSTLLSIGDMAFSNTAIIDLRLPDNVRSIGVGCFSGCYMLEKAKLPKGIKEISASLFSGSWKLRTVAVPRGIKEIHSMAFSTKPQLGKNLSIRPAPLELYIPDTVETISPDAFGRSLLDHINITLYCNRGSYALQYARENKILYKEN